MRYSYRINMYNVGIKKKHGSSMARVGPCLQMVCHSRTSSCLGTLSSRSAESQLRGSDIYGITPSDQPKALLAVGYNSSTAVSLSSSPTKHVCCRPLAPLDNMHIKLTVQLTDVSYRDTGTIIYTRVSDVTLQIWLEIPVTIL